MMIFIFSFGHFFPLFVFIAQHVNQCGWKWTGEHFLKRFLRESNCQRGSTRRDKTRLAAASCHCATWVFTLTCSFVAYHYRCISLLFFVFIVLRFRWVFSRLVSSTKKPRTGSGTCLFFFFLFFLFLNAAWHVKFFFEFLVLGHFTCGNECLVSIAVVNKAPLRLHGCNQVDSLIRAPPYSVEQTGR